MNLEDHLSETPGRLAAAYIRESTAEQDRGYSPENQQQTIQRYANQHSMHLVQVYKDLESGTNASKRPEFQRMIDDAREGRFAVILVFHTSRFARNVQESRFYKTMLRKRLGVDVVSVTQHFGKPDDPSTFLNEGINELFDEYYSWQLSFWLKSNLRAKRNKGYQLGQPPLGYYKERIGVDPGRDRPIYDQEVKVDEDAAETVRTIFAIYASGEHSYRDIAGHLNTQGLTTTRGRPFCHSTIRSILQNTFYIGRLSSRRGLPDIRGRHVPIISNELFEKVQDMRARRAADRNPPRESQRI